MKLDEIDLLKIGNTIQIAGAVYVGEGQVILAMFPEERGALSKGASFEGTEGSLSVECLDMDLADWTRFLLQTDVLETQILEKASDGKIAKAVVRKSQRMISQEVSWAVYKRDKYRCRYCGADSTPLTVDHLVLWEEGGPSIEANLLSACRKCNRVRGNTQYAAWLEHPRYRATAKNLDAATRQANLDLIPTLDAIPRSIHQRTRR